MRVMLGLILLLGGCYSTPEHLKDGIYGNTAEDLNREPVSVVQIEMSDGPVSSVGTAFSMHQTGDIIRTAKHVIAPNEHHPVDLKKSYKVHLPGRTIRAQVTSTCLLEDFDIVTLIVAGDYRRRSPIIVKTPYHIQNAMVVGDAVELRSAVNSPSVRYGTIKAMDAKFLIVDIPTYPGDSGGPLLDAEGYAIGIMVEYVELEGLFIGGKAVRLDYFFEKCLESSKFG